MNGLAFSAMLLSDELRVDQQHSAFPFPQSAVHTVLKSFSRQDDEGQALSMNTKVNKS